MIIYRKPESIWEARVILRNKDYAWNIASLAGRNLKSALARKTATIVAYDRIICSRELKRKTQNENSTYHTA